MAAMFAMVATIDSLSLVLGLVIAGLAVCFYNCLVEGEGGNARQTMEEIEEEEECEGLARFKREVSREDYDRVEEYTGIVQQNYPDYVEAVGTILFDSTSNTNHDDRIYTFHCYLANALKESSAWGSSRWECFRLDIADIADAFKGLILRLGRYIISTMTTFVAMMVLTLFFIFYVCIIDISILLVDVAFFVGGTPFSGDEFRRTLRHLWERFRIVVTSKESGSMKNAVYDTTPTITEEGIRKEEEDASVSAPSFRGQHLPPLLPSPYTLTDNTDNVDQNSVNAFDAMNREENKAYKTNNGNADDASGPTPAGATTSPLPTTVAAVTPSTCATTASTSTSNNGDDVEKKSDIGSSKKTGARRTLFFGAGTVTVATEEEQKQTSTTAASSTAEEGDDANYEYSYDHCGELLDLSPEEQVARMEQLPVQEPLETDLNDVSHVVEPVVPASRPTVRRERSVHFGEETNLDNHRAASPSPSPQQSSSEESTQDLFELAFNAIFGGIPWSFSKEDGTIVTNTCPIDTLLTIFFVIEQMREETQHGRSLLSWLKTFNERDLSIFTSFCYLQRGETTKAREVLYPFMVDIIRSSHNWFGDMNDLLRSNFASIIGPIMTRNIHCESCRHEEIKGQHFVQFMLAPLHEGGFFGSYEEYLGRTQRRQCCSNPDNSDCPGPCHYSPWTVQRCNGKLLLFNVFGFNSKELGLLTFEKIPHSYRAKDGKYYKLIAATGGDGSHFVGYLLYQNSFYFYDGNAGRYGGEKMTEYPSSTSPGVRRHIRNYPINNVIYECIDEGSPTTVNLEEIVIETDNVGILEDEQNESATTTPTTKTRKDDDDGVGTELNIASRTRAAINKKTMSKKHKGKKQNARVTIKKKTMTKKKFAPKKKKKKVAPQRSSQNYNSQLTVDSSDDDEGSLWNKIYERLSQIYKDKGHSVVTRSDPDQLLYQWTCKQKEMRTEGRLPAWKVKKLSAIKFCWNEVDKKWDTMCKELTLHHKQNATGPPAHLLSWILDQREAYNDGSITREHEDALQEIDPYFFIRRPISTVPTTSTTSNTDTDFAVAAAPAAAASNRYGGLTMPFRDGNDNNKSKEEEEEEADDDDDDDNDKSYEPIADDEDTDTDDEVEETSKIAAAADVAGGNDEEGVVAAVVPIDQAEKKPTKMTRKKKPKPVWFNLIHFFHHNCAKGVVLNPVTVKDFLRSDILSDKTFVGTDSEANGFYKKYAAYKEGRLSNPSGDGRSKNSRWGNKNRPIAATTTPQTPRDVFNFPTSGDEDVIDNNSSINMSVNHRRPRRGQQRKRKRVTDGSNNLKKKKPSK